MDTRSLKYPIAKMIAIKYSGEEQGYSVGVAHFAPGQNRLYFTWVKTHSLKVV
jgi:hypothetical protein